MDQIKLFCLPYAGGSAGLAYRKWNEYLSSDIKLCPLEYAGRGPRMKEALYQDMKEAVEDLYIKLFEQIDNEPYYLFGHSMGALIIYELLLKIKKNNFPMPNHVFISGRIAPDLKSQKMMHTLDYPEFIKELKALNGTPEEVLNNDELMKYFYPILLADYKVVEQYEHNPDDLEEKLDLNFSILAGKEDQMAPKMEDIYRWQNFVKRDCTFHIFEGGHFFINDETEKIVEIINNTNS